MLEDCGEALVEAGFVSRLEQALTRAASDPEWVHGCRHRLYRTFVLIIGETAIYDKAWSQRRQQPGRGAPPGLSCSRAVELRGSRPGLCSGVASRILGCPV